MSSASTRRERESEQTRLLIMEAASDLFVNEGYNAVSVRKIAARAGISHGTIYIHFRDKDDLLYQVSEEQFRRLLDRLRRLPRSRDVLRRLHDALIEVIEFGIAHPNDYQLMMGFRAAVAGQQSSDQWGPQAEQVANFFGDLLDEGHERGLLRAGRREVDELVLLSLMRGIVVTILIEELDRPRAAELAERMVSSLLAGLQSKSQTDSGGM